MRMVRSKAREDAMGSVRVGKCDTDAAGLG